MFDIIVETEITLTENTVMIDINTYSRDASEADTISVDGSFIDCDLLITDVDDEDATLKEALECYVDGIGNYGFIELVVGNDTATTLDSIWDRKLNTFKGECLNVINATY